MRQSPYNQIVRIGSELWEEQLHSSSVHDAPGMGEATQRQMLRRVFLQVRYCWIFIEDVLEGRLY